jgi:tetratricopeptide (TPR) repeat protein
MARADAPSQCRRAGGHPGPPAQSCGELSTLGLIARDAGDWPLAERCFDEALALYRAFGRTVSVASVLTNLGITAERRGDYTRAKALLEESLAVKTELGGNEWSKTVTLNALACVARLQGDDGRAAALFEQCLALARELRSPREVAWCLEGLAGLAADHGHLERATRLFGAAEGLRTAAGITVPAADQTSRAHRVAALSTASGEESFVAVWVDGKAMSLGQAIAYALNG